MITVQKADVASEELLRAVRGLLAQLSSEPPTLTLAQLEAVVTSGATTLWCAYEGSAARSLVVGMLTLAWYPLPSGLRVWIEDVVVDRGSRGHGIGAALVGVALDHARSLGAVRVDLTSSPEREAARRLYQRLGFQRRDTGVYRYTVTTREAQRSGRA